MPRKKQTLDTVSLEQLKKDAYEWETWDKLAKSDVGQFLMKWIDSAIEETLDNEDRTDIYKMDSQAREYFFASVRSKRQTLKAIKEKMIKASSEKDWRTAELARLTPDGE